MQRFKNILCVVGTELKSSSALERAVTLAENNQASLTVVEVIDDAASSAKVHDRTAGLQESIVVEHQRRLEELVAPWTKNIEIQAKILTGVLFLEVIREVLRSKCDLIIKTPESSRLLDSVFGRDDMHLLRNCPCPVWLTKPNSRPYRRILVSVDVDDSYPAKELNTRHLLNIQILEMASSLALSEFAELHIVHIWEAIGEGVLRGPFVTTPEGEVDDYVEEVKQRRMQNLNALMDEVIRKTGRNVFDYIEPKTHLIKGTPSKEIPELSEKIKADVVVMGTVARTGISRFFMGNTAETIIDQLNCSLLAIKPLEFETPVTLEGQESKKGGRL